MVRLRGLLAAIGMVLASTTAAAAQRDTIRLGAPPRDTVVLGAADTAAPAAPARDPRWATPFAVQSSGQAVPNRPAHEVVWLDADSVRARRRAARLAASDSAAAPADSAVAETPSDTAAAADSAPPPPRRNRRAAADSATTTPRRTRTAADSATTTPRRTRTAARDTTGARRSPPADSAERRRTTSTTTRPRTHRVVEGETLYGIARRYGVTTAQLRALNPDLVVGELATGTVLRLPAGARNPDAAASTSDTPREEAPARPRTTEGTETPPRRPASETRTPARGRRTHTVAAGETLYGIARRYGVTVDALKATNRLTSDTVRPGQTLAIPAAAPR